MGDQPGAEGAGEAAGSLAHDEIVIPGEEPGGRGGRRGSSRSGSCGPASRRPRRFPGLRESPGADALELAGRPRLDQAAGLDVGDAHVEAQGVREDAPPGEAVDRPTPWSSPGSGLDAPDGRPPDSNT